MPRSNIVSVLFLCLLVGISGDSGCFPKFCVYQDVIPSTSEHRCHLTIIQSGNETCNNIEFSELGSPSTGESFADFDLKAYLYEFDKNIYTSFNFTMTNITFDRLFYRYQMIGSKSSSKCREIRLYENGKDPAPKELFVDCLFNDYTDRFHYKLEILASKNNERYTRTFVFISPTTKDREERKGVKKYTPFIYADITDQERPQLHIQSAPAEFNITGHKFWVMKKDSQDVVGNQSVLVGQKIEYLEDYFSDGGSYYFEAAMLHPDCGDEGCMKSATPVIEIRGSSLTVVITMVSVIWIPPAIMYTIYRIYCVYRRKELDRIAEKQRNCLLVYSPTHPAHVTVMTALSKYFRRCKINAQIDVLDIPSTTHKDPGRWCDEAFKSADIILVASSPPPNNLTVPVVYTKMDDHALRLMKENFPYGNKRYYAIQFPYCNSDDLHQDARKFRVLNVPKELDRLVQLIYGIGYIKFIGESKQELLESIKEAEKTVILAEPRKNTILEQHDNHCPPIRNDSIIIDCDDAISMNEDTDKPNRDDRERELETYETNLMDILGGMDEEQDILLDERKQYEADTCLYDLAL